MKYAFFILLAVGCAAMVMRHNGTDTTLVAQKTHCTEDTKTCNNAKKKSCCMSEAQAHNTALASLSVNSPDTKTAEEVKFFDGSWKELLAAATKQKKPFWVDVYTTWCGPCKIMSKTTFTDDGVGKASNKGFIAYKLDAEKGEGIKLASEYNVDAYPTVLFFSADGKLLGREVGLQDAERFAFTMDKYMKKTGKTKKPKK